MAGRRLLHLLCLGCFNDGQYYFGNRDGRRLFKLRPPLYSSSRLLLYTDLAEGKAWIFFDPATGATFRCGFPGARFHFSKDGWLFLSQTNDPSDLFLFNPFTGRRIAPGDGSNGGATPFSLLKLDSSNHKVAIFGVNFYYSRRKISTRKFYLASWKISAHVLVVPKNGDRGDIEVFELDFKYCKWCKVKGMDYRRFFLVGEDDLHKDPPELVAMEEEDRMVVLPDPRGESDGDVYFSVQVKDFHGGRFGGAASSSCKQAIWVDTKWSSGSEG